jgi:hypothetical protein
MYKKLIGIFIVIISLVIVAPLSARNPQDGKQNQSRVNLTEAEIQYIKFIRQEEKLARDVYLTLNDEYQTPIFLNISESEQRHMDAMKSLIDKYELEDPIKDDTIGVFPDPESSNEINFNELYNDLVENGMQTYCDALQVGIDIEELDIEDIEIALNEEDVTAQDVIRVLNNLLSGSYNHLGAFTSQFEANNCEQ